MIWWKNSIKKSNIKFLKSKSSFIIISRANFPVFHNLSKSKKSVSLNEVFQRDEVQKELKTDDI